MPVSSPDNEIVRFFGKHAVALSCLITFPGQAPQFMMISGFVVSVRKRCLFITAGHVLELIKTVHKQGGAVTDWAIYDGLGPDPKHRVAIPFAYNAAPQFYWHDSNGGIDYAVISFRKMYYDLIRKNGVIPLPEEAWMVDDIYNFETYYLYGFPKESVNYTHSNFKVKAENYLLEVIPTDNPPDAIQKAVPRFYGRIPDVADGAPDSIVGMSGGPIYALRKNDEGKPEFRAVAVQSSWSPKDRVIAACPLKVFCEWIGNQIERAEAEGTLETGVG